MKYTVSGFSQKKLVEFGLDLKDAMLLRYFVDFRDTESMSMIIINNKPFYWLKYEALKDDIPILGISSNIVLRRRLKKLEECGILEHYHKLEGGSFSYYALGPKYKELIAEDKGEDFNNYSSESSDPTQTKKFNPLNSKVQPLKPKSLTPQTQKFKQNNQSTKDNKKENKKEKNSLDDLIDSYSEKVEVQETIRDFLKMRKAIKKPVTDRALKSILKKLDLLARNEIEKIAILEYSIENCYQGVFPLKNQINTNPVTPKKQNYKVILKEDM